MIDNEVVQGHCKTLYKRVLPILERRLPHSCLMLNQLKLFYKSDISDSQEIYCFKDNTQANPGLTEDEDVLWIVFKFPREDWGHAITISPPLTLIHGSRPQLPPKFQNFLESSGVIDWTKPFVFFCVDLRISDFIIPLNLRKFGNIMKIFPCHLFYMDPEDAKKLEVETGDPSVQIRPLTPSEGETFLVARWSMTYEGTSEYVQKCVRNRMSCGIIVHGEVVCAALMPGFEGNVSFLMTHPSHRRKGYASLLVKYMFRKMAEQGLQPSLDVDISDKAAVAFHKSVNPRIIANVDYVCHKAMNGDYSQK